VASTAEQSKQPQALYVVVTQDPFKSDQQAVWTRDRARAEAFEEAAYDRGQQANLLEATELSEDWGR
jgi:hypothetical protein